MQICSLKSLLAIRFHGAFRDYSPFTHESILLDLPLDGVVLLEVFDIQGRMKETLIQHESYSTGGHQIQWTPDGRPSSICLTRIHVDGVNAPTSLSNILDKSKHLEVGAQKR